VLAESLETLEKAEASRTDMLEFKRAVENSREELENRLFILQCWSPVSAQELLQKIGDAFKLYHYAEEPEEHERMPVKLENPKAFESGEDLVKIYSYPSHKDFDPSPFVLYCFAVFFGMIVGDFGYGLVLLGLTVWVHRKVKDSTSPMAARMVRLMYMLTFSVLVWGVIGAGFFGMTLEPDHPLVRISVMDYNSQEGQKEIMIISILIGMIHICLSLLIRLYKERDLSSVGWIVAIWSAFFYLNSKMAHEMDNPPAMYGMIAGLAVVFLFSSKSRNPLVRVAEGLQGLLGIVQIFSDVLSYLRLFALGVATVYIAQTFNILAGSVSGSLPVLGYVFAGIILFIGHTLNIGLAIMGGVIHGLRLNFLEWYRWCFEGDGLEYKPFQRIGD
jgi:V/A-type H+-transporting ATPase subunit I